MKSSSRSGTLEISLDGKANQSGFHWAFDLTAFSMGFT